MKMEKMQDSLEDQEEQFIYLYACANCDAEFEDRKFLNDHIVMRVCEAADITNYETKKNNTFLNELKCNVCDKQYQKKKHLQNHMKTHNKSLVCHICQKSYKTLKILNNHQKLHSSKMEYFECNDCGKKFKDKQNLSRHIKSLHQMKKARKWIKCVYCDDLQWSLFLLKSHYERAHSLKMKHHEMRFDSDEDFHKWRQDEEKQTLSKFVITHRYRTKQCEKMTYSCHRSGLTVATSAKTRQRAIQINGYKKIGGWCPAEMRVQIDENGRHHVVYQSSHAQTDVHKVIPKDGQLSAEEIEKARYCELKYLYINKDDRERILTKLVEGVKPSNIFIEERLEADDNSPLGFLNKKQMRNIACQYNVSYGAETRLSDAGGGEEVSKTTPATDDGDGEFENTSNLSRVDESVITKYRDDILYFKKSGKDCRMNVFEKADFALVIMSREQETILKQFANDMVAIDVSSVSLTGVLCFVITLLVIDDSGCASPVAILLSNRNDDVVMNVFLCYVKLRTGAIETRIFIEEMKTSKNYYKQWSTIMGDAEYRRFCKNDIRISWKKILAKIVDAEKRSNVAKLLDDLFVEKSVALFEVKLIDMLLMEDDDEDVRTFLDKFKTNYVQRTPPSAWARCYSSGQTDLNATAIVQSFHRTFIFDVVRSRKVTTMTELCSYMFQYIRLCMNDKRERSIKGKLTTQMARLRKHHKTACLKLQNESFDVNRITDSSYLVQGHSVTRTINLSKYCGGESICKMVCHECKCCQHTWTCTCLHSSVHNDMCEHIHSLQMYLRRDESSGDSDENDIAIEDYCEQILNITESPEETVDTLSNIIVDVVVEDDSIVVVEESEHETTEHEDVEVQILVDPLTDEIEFKDNKICVSDYESDL